VALLEYAAEESDVLNGRQIQPRRDRGLPRTRGSFAADVAIRI